jgi:Bacterial membrane protein YfhO
MSHPRIRAIVLMLAGPVLIVGAVLTVMHSFLSGSHLTDQDTDILALVLPTYCLMGKSLAAGHILSWNPYSLGGAPFAADPQSGWLYFPVMLLFSIFPCAKALGWFIVLQPIIAGLGLYWFLRGEGLSRVAATVGGLALAMLIADSRVALSVAFSGSLAWTAMLLGAFSWYLRATTTASRVARCLVVALVWGQLLAAYASDGLAMGAIALLVYLAWRIPSDVRAGRRSWRRALGIAAIPVLAFPLVNLAALLPRVDYIKHSTLGLGYRHLIIRKDTLSGLHYRPKILGLPAAWPLEIVIPLGLYLGPTLLVLSGAGAWSRRFRWLWAGFGLLGAISYVLTLTPVDRWIVLHIGSWPLVDFYTHDATRLRYPLLLAVAIAAAIGVQAWAEERSWRRRILMLVPGAVVWFALTPIVGLPGHNPFGSRQLLVVGLVAAPIVLALSALRRPLLVAIPLLVAVELAANGLLGTNHPFDRGPRFADTGGDFGAIGRPAIDTAAYLRPTAISKEIRTAGGRYMAYAPGVFRRGVGYLPLQGPAYWPLLANGRSVLLGIPDAQGYNSIQLLRFWSFIRAAGHTSDEYNLDYYLSPSRQLMNLLDVRWVIEPPGIGSPTSGVGLSRALLEGPVELDRVQGAPGLVSLVDRWRVVGSADAALRAVTAGRFDPSTEAVVERSLPIRPAAGPPASPGAAHADVVGPQDVVVTARASIPAILLVRIPYDSHWHASVDGRPASIVAVDSFVQGIPLGPGSHTVRLTYDDPLIGDGLVGSAVAIVALLGLALWLRRRRQTPPLGARPVASPDPNLRSRDRRASGVVQTPARPGVDEGSVQGEPPL